ncbi:hypothetical protein H0H81_009058 [Sphagnurus paluster]|uniref:Uncharacterized protein n=1 Tax=Sphagnurus paluster TaxID=117069 RepID=A0A9P7GNM4_9AGAR|nr:hypothetical protein H0H81_009058 [Sphagnurus paluster]
MPVSWSYCHTISSARSSRQQPTATLLSRSPSHASPTKHKAGECQCLATPTHRADQRSSNRADHLIYRNLFFTRKVGHFRREGDGSTALQKFGVVLEARPASFFASHVRSLHFDGDHSSEKILPVIRVCTGVSDFGLYATIGGPTANEVYRLVHTLPLKTLFISSANLALLCEHEPATSCLKTLQRLALVDTWTYPARKFPALTHLALAPDFDSLAVTAVKAALAMPQIVSVVAMLTYVNTPRQSETLQALRALAGQRFVLFTLPVSPTRYIEDDLWDLANEYPDEETQIGALCGFFLDFAVLESFANQCAFSGILEEIPGPRILSYEEFIALGV